MITVWRFPIKLTERTVVLMPAGARTLTVGPFRQPPGSGLHYVDPPLDLWALLDPAESEVEREFFVVGTGHPVPDDARNYIGTTHSHGGSLIWHVFEAARTYPSYPKWSTGGPTGGVS